MVVFMKKVAGMNVELTVEERNLLSVAYKNVIGARRASWRIISSIEQREESKNEKDRLNMIENYRRTVRYSGQYSEILWPFFTCAGQVSSCETIYGLVSKNLDLIKLSWRFNYGIYFVLLVTGWERAEIHLWWHSGRTGQSPGAICCPGRVQSLLQQNVSSKVV